MKLSKSMFPANISEVALEQLYLFSTNALETMGSQ
jgi:hypothetical protein